DAIADAILQGRFRYAARLLFIWREGMTTKDERLVQEDVKSFEGHELCIDWSNKNTVVTLRYNSEVYSYRQQDVTDERW
ncbi:hypothetical protein, partial [Halobacteriovorax sp. GFR8]|uniref:hypothetical protein n=1 Tax=Halobacteriovorax sp. GFR8 TaxID=3436041 RepID=UPI003D958DDA